MFDVHDFFSKVDYILLPTYLYFIFFSVNYLFKIKNPYCFLSSIFINKETFKTRFSSSFFNWFLLFLLL